MKNIKKFDEFPVNENVESNVAKTEEQALNEDLAAMWDSIQSLFTDPTIVNVAGEAITKGALVTSLAATLLGLPIVGVGLSKLQDWWKGAEKEDSKAIIKAIKNAKKGAELSKFIKPKKA